jgi:hypothetical protein
MGAGGDLVHAQPVVAEFRESFERGREDRVVAGRVARPSRVAFLRGRVDGKYDTVLFRSENR